MGDSAQDFTPEWSYLFGADDVESEAVKLTISPDADELSALCQRLSVLSFDSLTAELVLKRASGNMTVHIKARVKAALKQACVVTLEPVAAQVDEEFEAWFADPEQAVQLVKAKREKLTKSGAGEVPILEEKDDPEAIIDGNIDLGELVVQHLCLMVDSYPHAEGVVYEYGDDDPRKVPEEFKTNPFAALKDWKSKLEE